MNNNEAYKPNIEKDTSLSDIIMITKPNKEIAIGFKASEQNDNYNNNDSSDIKLYEKKQTFNLLFTLTLLHLYQLFFYLFSIFSLSLIYL